MTRIKRFDIVLDRQELWYFPGQTVSGKVEVEVTEPLDVSGISLRCKGEALVSWTEGSGENSKSIGDVETYIDTALNLNGDSTGDVQLKQELNVFPFHMLLPEGIPMSFEGGCGFVRYYLKAKIHRTFKSDMKKKLFFTVGGYGTNLDNIPEAWLTMQTTDSKTVGCLCCESEPVECTLKLDKSGFCIEEGIVFNAEIDNRSTSDVRKSRFDIKMITYFRTRGGSWTVTHNVIASVEKGPVRRGTSETYLCERIPLPEGTYPTGVPYCPLIEVTYMLEWKVDICDTMYPIRLSTPIVIGTEPSPVFTGS